MDDLVDELKKAGLNSDPRFIIGKMYGFGYGLRPGRGPNCILYGKILAIGISFETGLQLYVSNPEFLGRKIIALVYNDETYQWEVYVESMYKKCDFHNMSTEELKEKGKKLVEEQESRSRYFAGDFEFL